MRGTERWSCSGQACALPGDSPTGASGCRARLAPAPAVAGPPPQRPPMPRDASWTRLPASRQVCLSPCEDHRERGRNATHCPGRPPHPQGHPKILPNRSVESIFGTHPYARSLCRPSGLTARARPKARPYRRAANLPLVDDPPWCAIPISYAGFAPGIWRFCTDRHRRPCPLTPVFTGNKMVKECRRHTQVTSRQDGARRTGLCRSSGVGLPAIFPPRMPDSPDRAG
jgi:hypothetical protein